MRLLSDGLTRLNVIRMAMEAPSPFVALSQSSGDQSLRLDKRCATDQSEDLQGRRAWAARAIAWPEVGEVNTTKTMASTAKVMVKASSVAIEGARTAISPAPVARPWAWSWLWVPDSCRTPIRLMCRVPEY